MSRTTTELSELEATRKTSLTRLLDLLAGWSGYVSADEQSGLCDPILSAEAIGDLYQAAGQASERWAGLSEIEQERAVGAFVRERIIPLLLRGRPGDADART